MSKLGFHKMSDEPPTATIISHDALSKFATLGMAQLFDIENDLGGFRFLHAHNDKLETKYIIMYFSGFQDDPILYELPIERFHMYVSFWIINLQVVNGGIKLPPGKPSPLDNLNYCLISIVENSKP